MVAAISGLFGLVAGSFINVVALRVPGGMPVALSRSACPECGHQIRARDNIPVLSWMLLAGRCRDCRAPISLRYPVVEAVTGALFLATPFVVGVSWVLPAYLWFVGVAVVLTLTDLDHQRIPNRILGPGVAVAVPLLGLGAALDGDLGSMGRGLAAGAAYFALFFVLALLARGGLGFGDVKLAALLGLYLGYQSWRVVAAGIGLGIVIGGAVALAMVVTRARGRKDAIPFGPSMVAGAFVALAVGERLVDWYLAL